jgi:hypothetical protein
LLPHEDHWRGALAAELVSAGGLDDALRLIDEGLGIQPGHAHLTKVRRQLAAPAVPCGEGGARRELDQVHGT